MQPIHFRTFIVLLILVSIAFLGITLPFAPAILWSVILAILFRPLNKFFIHWTKERVFLSAFLTLMACILLVVLPISLIIIGLVNDVSHLYEQLASGKINVGAYAEHIYSSLPEEVHGLLEKYQLNDFVAIKEKLRGWSIQASRGIAVYAVTIGQNTFEFMLQVVLMLYILFFLLKDGDHYAHLVYEVFPMSNYNKDALILNFIRVVKATVKGNIVVAIVQGALGGFIFAFLGIQGALFWGVLMVFLSLLPAIGAAIVWGPVAIYFFAIGEISSGVILTLFGFLVIGLIDNILRPILVGKDTKLPDFVVLITTLGGISLFGISGFVIGPLIAALFIATWSLLRTTVEVPID